jgi:hypothetical protein
VRLLQTNDGSGTKGRVKVFRYISLAALCLAATPVHADEVNALQAGTIDVGSFHGIVYYTQEHDGYRVVTTIADGEAALPVRFEATLAEGQKLSISVPGNLGEKSHVVKISRDAGKLVIETPQYTRNEVEEVTVNRGVVLVRALHSP